MKYDHKKLVRLMNDKYIEKYGRPPGSATSALIEIMDDTFLDEFQDEIVNADEKLVSKYDDARQEVKNNLEIISKEADEIHRTLYGVITDIGISDPRVADALKAYMAIVSMRFNTPQQDLENIKNASYFVWALFANDGLKKPSFRKTVKGVPENEMDDNEPYSPFDFMVFDED